MAGHDKERDRGHDHRSNGSTVQAAGVELARQELRTYAVSRPSMVQRPSPRLSSITRALGRPVACRMAYRFLSFELLDECGEMRGDRGRKGVVLILEALPNC